MSSEYEERSSDSHPLLHCPVLVSERLILREPHIEDMDAMTKLANNRNVSSMLQMMPCPYTRKHAAEFILRFVAGEFGYCVYAITLMDTGEFVGVCSLQTREEGEGVEINYWIGQPYWRKGFASEAVNALIDGAFRATNLDKLYVASFLDNTASRRIIEKMGFNYTSTSQRYSVVSGLKDTNHFVLHREEWLGLRSLVA